MYTGEASIRMDTDLGVSGYDMDMGMMGITTRGSRDHFFE
jgi:hypothetical protein